MKRILFVFCFVLLGLINCKKDAYPYHTLGIDLQSGFNNDTVQVYIDNNLIIDNIFTTAAILGVCDNGIFRTEKLNGNYTLKLEINGQIMKTEVIHLNKSKYVGIIIDNITHQVQYRFSETPYLYE